MSDMFKVQGDVVESLLLQTRRVVGERWHFLGDARLRLLSGYPKLWWAEMSPAGGYSAEVWRLEERMQRGEATFVDAAHISDAAVLILDICAKISSYEPSPAWLTLPPYGGAKAGYWTGARGGA